MTKYMLLYALALAFLLFAVPASAFVLEDPATGRGMNVTSDGHGEVVAITEAGFEHASEKDGLSFSWNSTYSATGGQEIISIQNDDNDRHLHIVSVMVSSDTSSLFTLFEVTSGTPAGTTITGQNLNLDSGKVAEETAFGNASVTGGLSGNTLSLAYVATGDSEMMHLDSALILAKNDVVAVTLATSGVAAITVNGFYSPDE